jgi:peptidoglycan/LPS O-acetylase OafA/YrhL
VEEHFYLVWPLTLIALLRLGQERAMLATVALVAGAVVWRAVVAADDLGRVYHSTDTRIAAPLIGCALAFFVRAGYRPGRIAGMASAAAIGVLMVMPPAWAQEKWGVGLLAAEVSMAVLIASCLRGDGIGRVLSMRAFTMTGRLSYGLYLWHLPIVLVLGPMGGLTVLETVLVFVLSYAAAGTSMRLVERPLSRFRRTAPPRSADRPALSAHA